MIRQNKAFGLIGLATKAGKVVCGTDAAIECIKKYKAKLLIIAKDSSEKTKENFRFLCEKYNVPIVELADKDSLSNAIGNKNKAIIVIKDKNFAEEIYRIIYGGDTIE